MKINEEILSELVQLKDEKLKEFLLWLMEFERDIVASRKPEYKRSIENELLKILEASNAENKQGSN